MRYLMDGQTDICNYRVASLLILMTYLALQFNSLDCLPSHFMDQLFADLWEEHLGECQLDRPLAQLVPLVGTLTVTVLSVKYYTKIRFLFACY